MANYGFPKVYSPLKDSLKRPIQVVTIVYMLAVFVICFMPQPHLFDGVQTPNIISFGRLRLLLVPFNSLIGLGQVDTGFEMVWIFIQNLLNVFLLYPLILGLLFLYPTLRSPKKAIGLALCTSLFIEGTQLLLDVLIDANRVFEVDDLWTNTLGGYLAFLTFYQLVKRFAILKS
ncbi:VanZ family protein [Streptococcus fryi]